MKKQTDWLSAFTTAIVEGQVKRFARLVKAASQAGALPEQLFAAARAAQRIAPIPGDVLGDAYEAVDAWRRLAARVPSERPQRVTLGAQLAM